MNSRSFIQHFLKENPTFIDLQKSFCHLYVNVAGQAKIKPRVGTLFMLNESILVCKKLLAQLDLWSNKFLYASLCKEPLQRHVFGNVVKQVGGLLHR